MTAVSRAALLCLCAAAAAPVHSQDLLKQIEAEVDTLVQATRRQLVTVIVPQSTEAGPLRSVSVASGLVIDDSLVVTAASVVAGISHVEIAPPEQIPQAASVVGVDKLGGVALLRTSHLGVPHEQRDDRDGGTELGALVLLVTSRFEDRAGCSIGAVTAVRPAGMDGQVTTEIEASAAAVPGSAGAVLVDVGGRIAGLVVGRIGRLEDPWTAAHGGVLAIPISEVRSIAGELSAHTRVRRNWLGVSVQEMTAALREILGVTPRTGVIVISVEDGSPALGAGIEVGDVILSCDGRPVRDPGGLMAAVAAAPAGARLRLRVLRNGDTVEAPVALAELPERTTRPLALEYPGAQEARIRALEEEITRLRSSLQQRQR